MDLRLILSGLEDLAERMGLRVRYERLEDDEVEVRSGRYRLRGEDILLMDRRLEPAARIKVLRTELLGMNLAGIYIKPYLRAFLEEGGQDGF